MSVRKISRRIFCRETAAALGMGLAGVPLLETCCVPTPPESARDRPPNFVLLFADDMGYSDWDLGGDPTIRTPNLNRMADQGRGLIHNIS